MRLDLPFEQIGALTLKNIARPVEAFVLRLDPEVADPPLSSNQLSHSKPTRPSPSVLKLGRYGVRVFRARTST